MTECAKLYNHHFSLTVKYLGLLAMSRILTTHPKSVQAHKDLILQCLDDKDESIRLRSLDLLYGMVCICTVWYVFADYGEYCRILICICSRQSVGQEICRFSCLSHILQSWTLYTVTQIHIADHVNFLYLMKVFWAMWWKFEVTSWHQWPLLNMN